MVRLLKWLWIAWCRFFDLALTVGLPFYTIWNAMDGNATQAAIFGFLWGTNVMMWLIRFEQWSNKRRREKWKDGT